jgi:hypothetical protein
VGAKNGDTQPDNTGVVPQELKYEGLNFNPADMSLSRLRNGTRVIATAYGVPAVLLNMSLQGGLTYQNPAALGEMWWVRAPPDATGANALLPRCCPAASGSASTRSDTFAPWSPRRTTNSYPRSQTPARRSSPLTVIGGTG